MITDDETGKLLYQAMKIAPGAEVKPVAQPAPPSFQEESARVPGPGACAATFAGQSIISARIRVLRIRIGLLANVHGDLRTLACAPR